MKKLFGVALGFVTCLAFCLAVAPGAFAIDDGSLENMTTEGLYDRNDAFDHALEPGLLYHLDRWRLYTNLSNYDSSPGDADRACCDEDNDYGWDPCNWDDSGSYLIGTSGPLGPGNMAFFYETNKYEFDALEIDRQVRTEEDTDSNGEYPTYDGDPEDTTTSFSTDGTIDSDFFFASACPTCSNRADTNGKIEENNFYMAYGMDFDMFSLGLSFAPEMRNEEFDVRVRRDEDNWPLNSFSAGMAGSTFYNNIERNMDYRVAFPKSNMRDYITYGETEHDTYYMQYDQDSNSGSLDRDINEYPWFLQSHIRPGGDWDMLVGVGYKDIEYEDDFSAVLRQSGSSSDSSVGRFYDYQAMVTVDGSVCEDRDGDEWRIFLSPTYRVNDLVSVRVDLEYRTEDGDFSGGQVAVANYTETYYNDQPGPDEIETWTYYERQNQHTEDGDYDIDTWEIEPRVYFTFDKVNFSMGVGYENVEEDVDWTETRDVFARYKYNINDGDATQDRVFEGGYTDERIEYDRNVEIETWRFPVAAEWMVTDKLTMRAGAAYYRQKIDATEKSFDQNSLNERWEVRDGTGDPNPSISNPTGPEDQYLYDGDEPRPYDDDTSVENDKESFELTTDWTTYHLGLGYQFTENLQFDLMFTNYGGLGGVDLDEAFASITIAF